MTKPPFPEVIDSSLMAAYKSCGQKAFMEYFLHWKSKDPSVHLKAGASYASGLEAARKAFYEDGRDPETAVALGLKALLKEYGDFQCPEDSAKSASRTAGALEFYFDRYPLGVDKAIPLTMPGGKRCIEFNGVEVLEAKHPETGNPLQYSWRIDMGVGYNGMKLAEDDKTTSQLGASWPKQWDLRCFSPEHELFTGLGWKPIAKIGKETEILQSDAEGNLSFTKPSDVLSYDFTGNLLEISGRRLSQLVTPNHRLLVYKRRGGTTVVLAESLWKQDEKDSLPLSGRHKEERLPDDIQRLLVMIQADAKLQGSDGKVTSGVGHRRHMQNRAVVLAFTKKRKEERCGQLLTRLGIRFNSNVSGFYISGYTNITELVDRVLDEKKEFRSGYETLFGDAFLDELEYWDGHGKQYYTNSEKNARFVCTVAALNDRSASAAVDAAGHWTVVISHDTERTRKSIGIQEVPYAGKVYCVSVPTGFLITRRRGEISLSGNSQFTSYIWGAARNGVAFDGFLVRGVSILKTKYDTLEAITYRPDWQIARWEEQLYRDLKRMISNWEEGYFDFNLDHACSEYGGCQFRNVCLNRDPSQILENMFERRQWNPVTRKETKL